MDNFGVYMRKQAERREAYEKLNYATANFKNAQIMERLAEIKSQHEPLNGLLTRSMSERDRLYAAAYYVAIGRMPEQADAMLAERERGDNNG